MSASDLRAELLLHMSEAKQLALAARRQLAIQHKPDGSIVTNADLGVEEYFQTHLPTLLPATEVWGEESGFRAAGSEGVWCVDPIDGTSNFAFGSPLWGISVALVHEGKVRVGAVCLPDLDMILSFEAGRGAFCNSEQLQPIPSGKIQPHELMNSTDAVNKAYPYVQWPAKVRNFGAFVVEGSFFCRQWIRAMVGYREKLYDIAAILGIANELGASIRYLDGDPFIIDELVEDRKIARGWILCPDGEDFTV